MKKDTGRMPHDQRRGETAVDVPIACSLTAGERSERGRRITELAAGSLRSRHPLPDGVRLVFAPDPGTEREVRALVDDETQCCPFLGFRLSRTQEALVLEVTGSQEARSTMDELFS